MHEVVEKYCLQRVLFDSKSTQQQTMDLHIYSFANVICMFHLLPCLICYRQTRMLADLTLINCYDTRSTDAATRDKIMLESAKINLKNLAFFGLKEHMAESQWMFEHLFRLKCVSSKS